MNLERFLDSKSEHIGITKADLKTSYSTERVKSIWHKMKKDLSIFINSTKIHVLGTNGKGSTGRYLALLLIANSKSVFHFTSPHLLYFSERFYRNGAVIGLDELERAHEILYSLDYTHAASYFEYCTLLAFFIGFECEFMIIEAGLGGELDATSIIDYDLSIFTPIDFDHMHILGSSIEEIATTKLKASSKIALLSPQSHKETLEIAKRYASSVLYPFLESSANFLEDNLKIARYAASFLGVDGEVKVELDLTGRYMRRENIIIDVGHNPHASKALLERLKLDFKNNLFNTLRASKTTSSKEEELSFKLIYNSLKTKDAKGVLEILAEHIDELLIIPLKECNYHKSIERLELEKILKDLGIKFSDFSPKKLNKESLFVVFGSFKVVESFLEWRLDT